MRNKRTIHPSGDGERGTVPRANDAIHQGFRSACGCCVCSHHQRQSCAGARRPQPTGAVRPLGVRPPRALGPRSPQGWPAGIPLGSARSATVLCTDRRIPASWGCGRPGPALLGPTQGEQEAAARHRTRPQRKNIGLSLFLPSPDLPSAPPTSWPESVESWLRCLDPGIQRGTYQGRCGEGSWSKQRIYDLCA